MQVTQVMVIVVTMMSVMQAVMMTAKVASCQVMTVSVAPRLVVVPGLDLASAAIVTVVQVTVMLVPVCSMLTVCVLVQVMSMPVVIVVTAGLVLVVLVMTVMSVTTMTVMVTVMAMLVVAGVVTVVRMIFESSMMTTNEPGTVDTVSDCRKFVAGREDEI